MKILFQSLIFIIFFSCDTTWAQCLPRSDATNPCRHLEGDSWCAEHDSRNPYAYSDSCLKASRNQSVDAKDVKHIPSKFHGAWSEYLETCKNPENDNYIEIKNGEYLVYEEECHLSKVEKITTDSFEGMFYCLDTESNKTKKLVIFTLIGGDKVRVNNVFGEQITLNKCNATTDDQDIESGLINALRLKKGTTERVGNSGKAIQAYMREGIVNKKPNARADYTDYYLVNKPAKFLGHDLIVIEEEYMTKYIGCCVSPGAGVTVKVIGDTNNLEEFAHVNGCTFTDNVNLQEELSILAINATLPQGIFASLRCRERDIAQ